MCVCEWTTINENVTLAIHASSVGAMYGFVGHCHAAVQLPEMTCKQGHVAIIAWTLMSLPGWTKLQYTMLAPIHCIACPSKSR